MAISISIYDFIKAFIGLLIIAGVTNQSHAGPSPEEMDYSVERPLKVQTVVRGDFRFDVITPKSPQMDVPGGQVSSWYLDELFVVRKLVDGEVVHSLSLRSENVKFVTEGLNDHFIILKEWSGGISCCDWIHVFRADSSFEVILSHNNFGFDANKIIHDENTLLLHREPLISIGKPNSIFNPKKFDLRSREWID
jgi:hypothetical protein